MAFDQASLQAAITKAIQQPVSAVPPGHTMALVSVVDVHGASLTVAKKVWDHWEVDGTVAHPWDDHGLDAGVTIHGSW